MLKLAKMKDSLGRGEEGGMGERWVEDGREEGDGKEGVKEGEERDR